MAQTEKQTYHVFGRKSYPESLQYVQQLTLSDTETLKEEALQGTGDDDWVELIAFPETAVIRVIPQDEVT